MVVMALVTTFMTTPVVMWLYPEWYQKKSAERSVNPEYDTESIDTDKKDPSVLGASRLEPNQYFSLVTMLNRIDTVPSMMALIRLLKQDPLTTENVNKSRLDIHALRLLELTQRASDIMKIQDIRETQKQDPVLNVLRTFTSLIGVESLQTRLDFRTPSEYINTVSDYSESVSADMILLPWVSNSHIQNTIQQEINPLDQHFAGDLTPYQISDADFASTAYSITHSTVGLFIDRGFGHIQDESPRLQRKFQIIVPFTHGGADDRAALIFALRLHGKAEVLVLKLTNNESSTAYATKDTINNTLNAANAQQTSDDALLQGLFTSTVASSNVILRSIKRSATENVSEYSTLLDNLENPLDKQDLVVLGRSMSTSNAANLPAYTPTPLEGGSSSSTYSRGFKSALGNTAYQILSAGTLASLVVIQAPTSDAFHHNTEV